MRLTKQLVTFIYLLFISLISHNTVAESLKFGQNNDGELVQKTPYKLPFESYSEYLDQIEQGAGGTKFRRKIQGLFSEEEYRRFFQGGKARGYRITYMSEGLKINGYMVTPANKASNLPVIIFNRGGVMKWGKIHFFQLLELYRVAERGYTVLASHYRGSGGSEGREEMDRGTVIDVLNLIKLAENLPEADAGRVGMIGFSRGGGVTYQALKNTNRIAAAIIRGGPVDHVTSHRRDEFDEHVYPFVIPGYAKNKEQALVEISSIFWYQEMAPNTPILLLHGGADWRVQADNALRMASKLQALQRPYRLKIYEGGSHGLFENYPDVRKEIDRWLDLYVKERKTAPRNRPVALTPKELE